MDYLFTFHENYYFGRKVITNRFIGFVAAWVAVQAVSLPLWAIVFFLGHKFGFLLFGL